MEEQTHCQDDQTTTKGQKTTKTSQYFLTTSSYGQLSHQMKRRKTKSKSKCGLIPTNSKGSTTSGTIKVNESSLEAWRKDAPLSKQSMTSLFMVTQGLAKRCK